ncbi:MAG: hypothetical protein HYV97_01450 [Bdellovibrio sp.]|nr:hypothetical protein [Bdellovibrio sp.]
MKLLLCLILFIFFASPSKSESLSLNAGVGCEIKSGVLYCWGNNQYGQLGTGNIEDYRYQKSAVLFGPRESNFSVGVSDVSVDGNHICAIARNQLYCWGSNLNHQVRQVEPDGHQEKYFFPQKIDLPNGEVPYKIYVGGALDCAITFFGNTYCWGMNILKPERDKDFKGPTEINSILGKSGLKVEKLAMGMRHVCMLTYKKGVLCFGQNFVVDQYGDYDHGTRFYRGMLSAQDHTLTQNWVYEEGNKKDIIDIKSSTYYTCLLFEKQIQCWGDNNFNQITSDCGSDVTQQPSGTERYLRTSQWAKDCSHFGPMVITHTNGEGVSGPIIDFAIGHGHLCYLLKDGVHCQGSNQYLQMGRDPKDPNNSTGTFKRLELGQVFDELGVLKGASALYASDGATCARNGSRFFCWGRNKSGVLLLDKEQQFMKVPTSIDLNVVNLEVGIGEKHWCAVYEGKIFCWGDNENGQLGNLSTEGYFKAPIPIYDDGGLKNKRVSKLVVNSDSTCVLTEGFEYYCWGNNQKEELLTGSMTNLWEPTKITPFFKSTPVQIRENFVVMNDMVVKLNKRRIYDNITHAFPSNAFEVGVKDAGLINELNCMLFRNGVAGCYDNEQKSKFFIYKNANEHISDADFGVNSMCYISNGGPYCYRHGHTNHTKSISHSELAYASDIAAGNDFGCALKLGKVMCFNFSDDQSEVSAERIDIEGFVDHIWVGKDSACAQTSGDLYCWSKKMNDLAKISFEQNSRKEFVQHLKGQTICRAARNNSPETVEHIYKILRYNLKYGDNSPWLCSPLKFFLASNRFEDARTILDIYGSAFEFDYNQEFDSLLEALHHKAYDVIELLMRSKKIEIGPEHLYRFLELIWDRPEYEKFLPKIFQNITPESKKIFPAQWFGFIEILMEDLVNSKLSIKATVFAQLLATFSDLMKDHRIERKIVRNIIVKAMKLRNSDLGSDNLSSFILKIYPLQNKEINYNAGSSETFRKDLNELVLLISNFEGDKYISEVKAMLHYFRDCVSDEFLKTFYREFSNISRDHLSWLYRHKLKQYIRSIIK